MFGFGAKKNHHSKIVNGIHNSLVAQNVIYK